MLIGITISHIMNQFRQSLSRFLTSSNAWIFLVSLVSFSFLWVLTFRSEHGWMVYLSPSKWVLFAQLLISLVFLFSPILLFSLLRGQIQSRVSRLVYLFLWASIFVMYPFCLGITDYTKALIPVQMEVELLIIIGVMLLCAEVITSPQTRFSLQPDLSRWKDIASPEWIIISILISFSLYSTIQHIQVADGTPSFLSIWLQHLCVLAVYYIFYKINDVYLVEQIYRQKGLFYYGFAFLGLVFLFFVPLTILYAKLPGLSSALRHNLGADWVGPDAPETFWSIYHGTLFALMFATIPLTILVQWFKQSNKIEKLSKEKSETELTLLKQQINPHFFFNTLNNVYSMSLTKDEQTPEAILQLSDLMRYVIYKGPETSVSLGEEIAYIEGYLAVQQLRRHQTVDIQFEQDIDQLAFPVAPLLFIIFIENAFKHGIEGAEGDGYLHLSLSQHGHQIHFSCENSIEEGGEKNDGGLGLKNLRRRLELLYPKQHTLLIEQTDTHYKVDLILDIEE